MSVVVRYSDIAVGAKSSFEMLTGKRLPASNLDLIKSEGATFKRYDTPFELNSMILDGDSEFLPEEGTAQIGYISEEMTNDNADFDSPLSIELISEETYTSAGVTLVFDERKNIYATNINIKWYNDDVLMSDADFQPTSANYFCNKKVEFYNKLVITFYSLNVPRNRLRLNSIEYGLIVEFRADELKSAKVIQEIDPISTSILINPFDFTIDSKKNVDFSFQTKQPIEVIFKGERKATTFVKSAKRKSKTIWEIQSEDYIGLMDSVYFKGGIYRGKKAFELLEEIFSSAKVPYEIKDGVRDIELTGYIPYTTCRNALMQVAFAIGAVVDTSNSSKVDVFMLSDEVSQEISKQGIMQGQKFEDETRVTAVELVSHAYRESSETAVAYEGARSGTGTNIYVSFSEPLHDLVISDGRIIESGVNYAIIDANDNCVLSGLKYEHNTIIHRKENPLVLSTDIENILSIENATLISSRNVDSVLDLCYNYLVRTSRTTMKIVDGLHKKAEKSIYGTFAYGSRKYGYTIYEREPKATKVGDYIEYETDFMGKKSGRIIKQSYALVGGVLVKDSVVR